MPTSAYYYDAVYWVAENGVTYGTSATTFSPDVIVSRAQMVTFLWRAHGSPAPRSSVNPFTDITSDMYYYDAVLWAVENGVTNGISATTFSPDATVTRAQAVTFQWRAAGSPAVSGSNFADVADSAYYAGAVSWAVANGVTNGTGGSNFSPDVGVSRAQAVTAPSSGGSSQHKRPGSNTNIADREGWDFRSLPVTFHSLCPSLSAARRTRYTRLSAAVLHRKPRISSRSSSHVAW